jgi:hypothetical protein
MPISAYAGTCIFLIVLAIIFRFLIAFKAVLEERWIDDELNRRYVVIRKLNTKERISSDSDSQIVLLTENGVEKDVMVVRKHIKGTMPWSVTTDGPRAVIDTAIAGILYLLYATSFVSLGMALLLTLSSMLSIMTMNVGYFISVLSGIFLGSLLVGRYATGAVADQTLHA